MSSTYLHLNLPRRLRYYFAFGVGLLYWYLLTIDDTHPAVAFAVIFFSASMVWLGLRKTPAGMEIRNGSWRFFLGHRQWAVPLGDIVSVRVVGWRESPQGLELRLRDGRTDILPPELTPEIGPLERALARSGIPLEV